MPQPRSLPLRLSLVQSVDQIRSNVLRFNRDAPVHRELSHDLLPRAIYWVQDRDAGTFAPAKFAGFRSMTFGDYDAGLRDETVGVAFDGQRTQKAIRAVLGRPFVQDSTLAERLIGWSEDLLGRGVLYGIKTEKWRFIRLPQTRRYWAMLARPSIFDVDAALQALETDTWTTKGKRLRRGDRMILWRALKDGKRGVVGLAEVLSDPEVMGLAPHGRAFLLDNTLDTPQERVWVRNMVPRRAPLWLDEDPTGALATLTVARAHGGTIFKVTPEQWHAVVSLLGGWVEGASVQGAAEEAADAIRRAEGRPHGGQGFRINAEARKAIEMHAMREAEAYFHGVLGYEIQDVSGSRPFDLLCTKQDEEIRVEVKGTTTPGEDVVLTRNEVKHAKANAGRVALFVVHSIRIEQKGARWVASGGERRVLHPWDLLDERLKAMCYTYSLPEPAEPQ